MTAREILTAAITDAKAKGEYPTDIIVPLGALPACAFNEWCDGFEKVQYCVNDQPLCGADVGTLVLMGSNTQVSFVGDRFHQTAEVRFRLDKYSWLLSADDSGNLRYPLADFTPIIGPEPATDQSLSSPKSWRDRPPLL